MIDTTGFAFPKPQHREGREKLTGTKYAKRRADVLQRDGFKCVVNGCMRRAFEVDHRTKRSVGRDDRPENLQSLCWFHHRAKDGGQRVVRSEVKWSRR